MRAAPPRITGYLAASSRWFSSSRFSFMITVDFTRRPDMPMTSALCSSAASRIAETGCLMPMLTTL
ncbi:hypothetical protein STANM309S_04842 [Streptomyces tanashiensis]